MILIIVESFLSLPSATRPFGERLRTYGRLPDLLPPTRSVINLIDKRLLTDKYCVT
ncbi:MAG: hypothetical protein LBB88_11100 [Planctomycetaceae bacterium]|nr:hypothetical protein [Planctomycetaceae bacterium]